MCSIIGYLGTSISAQALRTGFDKTISRGPDDTRMLHIGAATLGFHRLAIMGLHPEGMQPFTRDGSALVCNGEIYGFRPIRERLIVLRLRRRGRDHLCQRGEKPCRSRARCDAVPARSLLCRREVHLLP